MKRTGSEFNYSKETEEIAKIAKALGHPARIIILKHLSNQSCCYTGELLDVLPLAQSTISQHLKELKDAGLIDGEVSPPKIKYCIHTKNWIKASKLFETLFKEDFKKMKCC
jgi:DNA-binding transcriptional ArsR family regulator